jgi:small subunit ribosomal protein S16
MRFGKKGHPAYRIVVLDKRKKAVGSYLEKIGTYNPLQNPAGINVDKTLLDKWLAKGAVVSEGVRKLLHLK